MINVGFNALGQPCTQNTCKMMNLFGSIARMADKLPIDCTDWRKMLQQNKEDAWVIAKEKCDIDDERKKWAIERIGRQWREWKSELKTKYFDLNLPCTDRRVIESQYMSLCRHWNTKESKDLCAQNKLNRSKLKVKHRGGTKAIPVYWEEEIKNNDGNAVSRGDMFIPLHRKKDGTYDAVEQNIIDQIKEIESQHPDISPAVAPNDSLGLVLGVERRGRVRMMGAGVTPTSVFGSTRNIGMSQERAASLQRANEELTNEVGCLREKQAQMEQTMQQNQAHLERQLAALVAQFQGVQNSNPLDNHTQSRSHGTSSSIHRYIHGDRVTLMSTQNDGIEVARGIRLSVDPTHEVDGVPLGRNFTMVQITVALEPKEPLIRKTDLYTEIGDAVGGIIAWPSNWVA
ncbi:uncharacterized protein LOC143856634 [Tasmannia lanceolata]|uniref:uncharacterized protein LOC143856634 n=1 Tax=Tasmannia lanceolata TaxID=3420 RepID=UPI0040643AD6